MSPATRAAPRTNRTALIDFSQGVVGGISELGRRVRHVTLCDNMFMRPAGAMRIRGGSQRISSAVLPNQPHSLGEWLAAAGSNKLFACTKSGVSSGVLYEVTASAFTAQTLPYSASNELMSYEQLNDALWGTQMLGTEKPVFFRSSNPANTWHSMVLPTPAAAPTFGADQAGGNLTPGVPGPAGDYFYRFRYRYTDGSSKASAVSTAQQVVPASGNYTIRVNTPAPGSPRSDYLGWTLERTKIGGSAAGPFYWVADGTAATYDDGAADADLFERTDENLHGEPLHFEGLIAHKDRLFGWVGSTLYASQQIGDEEATGLANWNFTENGYSFGKDDGDAIQACVVQQDRIIVVKQRSWWALEGDDPSSFRVVPLFEGAGAAGPRAVSALGSTVWCFGSGGTASPNNGLHRLDGNRLRPAGWVEMGHYFDQFAPSLVGQVELVQYRGEYLMVAYSRGATFNDEHVIYDQRFDNWTHFTNWRMRGALVQRGSQFGGATLIWCDPRNWPIFTKSGVLAGMTVTGPGIPGATTVVSVSADGASFVLSNAATATAGPVTLTFAGSIAITTCWTDSTTTVVSKDYRIWQGFRGFKDEKEADGTGGSPVPIAIETPWVDDGIPDVFKDYGRCEVYALADNETLAVSLSFDPTIASAALSASIKNSGALWGAFTWGAVNWAAVNEATATSGIPEGSIARRMKARITGNISGDLLFKGLVVDSKLRAERRYS